MLYKAHVAIESVSMTHVQPPLGSNIIVMIMTKSSVHRLHMLLSTISVIQKGQ